MKILYTNKKEEIIVDNEDFEYLSQFTWHLSTSKITKIKYALTKIKRKNFLLHRLLLNISSHLLIDHKNGNGLDNRKCNLRICNKSTNGMNRGKQKNNLSSKYKGVSKRKDRNCFRSYITINKKTMHLGNFKNEKDAAKAYNEAALKYHKEFAYLNKI